MSAQVKQWVTVKQRYILAMGALLMVLAWAVGAVRMAGAHPLPPFPLITPSQLTITLQPGQQMVVDKLVHPPISLSGISPSRTSCVARASPPPSRRRAKRSIPYQVPRLTRSSSR